MTKLVSERKFAGRREGEGIQHRQNNREWRGAFCVFATHEKDRETGWAYAIEGDWDHDEVHKRDAMYDAGTLEATNDSYTLLYTCYIYLYIKYI